MPPKTAKDNRPRIWSEGSQNPPFQVRAFALASVLFAREGLGDLLTRCSTSAAGFAATVATGRWRVPGHRLGRSGRFLPSVAAMAAAISGGAAVLSRAASVVRPEAPAELPAPGLFDSVAEPRPVAQTVTDADLSVLRAMFDDAGEDPPETGEPEPAKTGKARSWMTQSAATVLGYGLLVLAVPVGAGLAAFAHMKGEDLRKVIAEG